jgi:hypothetical protein
VTAWAERVTEWEAAWARLDPPATMSDLIGMARTGKWPTPNHRAAYDEWAPHAGRRLVEAIRDDTGHDLLSEERGSLT